MCLQNAAINHFPQNFKIIHFSELCTASLPDAFSQVKWKTLDYSNNITCRILNTYIALFSYSFSFDLYGSHSSSIQLSSNRFPASCRGTVAVEPNHINFKFNFYNNFVGLLLKIWADHYTSLYNISITTKCHLGWTVFSNKQLRFLHTKSPSHRCQCNHAPDTSFHLDLPLLSN